MAEVNKGELYTRYHALSVRKSIRSLQLGRNEYLKVDGI